MKIKKKHNNLRVYKMKENENFSNFASFENHLNFYVIFIPTFLNLIIDTAKLNFLGLKIAVASLSYCYFKQ